MVRPGGGGRWYGAVVLKRIRRLLALRGEEGPRVDVGPMFRGETPANLSDRGVIEAADTVDRLPPRDYVGEESGDLTLDAEAEAQRWEHERELYTEKNEGPGSAD
jgi:hypothetical protein